MPTISIRIEVDNTELFNKLLTDPLMILMMRPLLAFFMKGNTRLLAGKA